MEYGPVPSFIKNVVDENIQGLEEVVAKYHRYFVKSLAEPNLDYLSESDLECLKQAIEENKDLDFSTLTDKSHDYAYNKAVWNINYIDMAKAAGADENLLQFISMQKTNDNLELI